jgi:hypothetical protein
LLTIFRNIRDYPLKIEDLSIDIAEEKIESTVVLNANVFSKKTEPKVEKIAPPPKQPMVAKKKQWTAPGQQPLTSETSFRKGLDGFYLYVDGARFLPYNCTVSRVSIVVLDYSFTQLEPKVLEFQQLDSDILEPIFTLSEEFLWKSKFKFAKS